MGLDGSNQNFIMGIYNMSEKQVSYVEWISTAILLFGIFLTAINVYPLNVYVQIVGNLGWLWIGFLWRKWSLVVIQIIACLIYFGGVVYTYWK